MVACLPGGVSVKGLLDALMHNRPFLGPARVEPTKGETFLSYFLSGNRRNLSLSFSPADEHRLGPRSARPRSRGHFRRRQRGWQATSHRQGTFSSEGGGLGVKRLLNAQSCPKNILQPDVAMSPWRCQVAGYRQFMERPVTSQTASNGGNWSSCGLTLANRLGGGPFGLTSVLQMVFSGLMLVRKPHFPGI